MSIFPAEDHKTYKAGRLSDWDVLKNTPIIPELSQEIPNVPRVVAPKDQSLEDIIGNNRIIIVSGAFFGDEAKGKFTDAFSHAPGVVAVARVNSGANAGHTIYHKGQKYVLHILPSAVFNDVDCFVGSNVVMDPVALRDGEVAVLLDAGVDYSNLMIGNSFITTPYHRIMDVLGSRNNSSTGVGISPTHASIATKSCPRLDDLLGTDARLRERIERDLGKHYTGFGHARGLSEKDIVRELERVQSEDPRKVPEHLLGFARADDKAGYLIGLYRDRVVHDPAFPKRGDVEHELRRRHANGGIILLESPQSNPLSNGVPQFHHTGTSAQTHASGVLAASGLNPSSGVAIINVTKAPGSSRVGVGNIPSSYTHQDRFSRVGIRNRQGLEGACADFDTIQRLYFENIGPNGILEPVIFTDETGEYLICEAMAMASSQEFCEEGATTGKPRITGHYDAVLGRMVNDMQGPYLTISCLDRGDLCDKVGLTVAYVVNLPNGVESIASNGTEYKTGHIIKPGDAVPDHEVLKHCHSITRVFDGWRDTPIAANTGYVPQAGEALPLNPSRFVSAVEQYTGAKVVAIGNGPNTEDVIWLEPRE